ncbi:hypothetical protein HMPREF9078_00020, partial [Capnocytophaga sp. oral taxon 380 str. F0488]
VCSLFVRCLFVFSSLIVYLPVRLAPACRATTTRAARTVFPISFL